VIDLAYLIHHWGEAYEINMTRRRFYAIRRDDGSVLDASTAEALLEKIRADSAERPVSRRIEADRPQPLDCRFRPEG
jgi:hypothetical protein